MGAAEAGFDCSAVLLSLLTSSGPTPTIPTSHLEEGAALEDLTDPLFEGPQKVKHLLSFTPSDWEDSNFV